MKTNNLPFLTSFGAVLSDRDIKLAMRSGYLKTKFVDPQCIQPSSIDLHLAKTLLVFARRRVKNAAIDLKRPVDDYMEYEVIDGKTGTVLHPREFVLGVTKEWFQLPSQLLANVEGKSSLGRLGMVVHATAGFIDPGFSGHATLEITNLTEQPLVIYAGMMTGQIRFSVLTSPAEHIYGDPILQNKYINKPSKNPRPMPSQFWKNFR